ncbi:MAG: DNA methylase [Myxococcales bacterium]|nr:DNA methylase [Myxococcales bacterium]|tara:strand:+ start:2047 stop:2964 length:918 start_codon:yes stop_codon:yes gene_type:complete
MARKSERDGIKNPYVRFRPLKKPKLEKQLTTLWDFPSQHYGKGQQGSAGYRGATPSYVIWNVIQRYTKPGDRVCDPFCGSGTTIDVCKDTGRIGLGYDLAPFRKDIEASDARALPLKDREVHLVFMDPPYGENIHYSDSPQCIGKSSALDGQWQKDMSQVFEEAYRVLRNKGILAVYVQDIWQQKTKSFASLGVDVARQASSLFDMIDHVAVVRRNKDLEKGNYRKSADEENFMLRGFNHLLVFRKKKYVPKDKPAPGARRSTKKQTPRGRPPAKKRTGRPGGKRASGPPSNRKGGSPSKGRKRK